jgi:hypothetical protein
VRTPRGKITSFDVPGNSHGTFAFGINDQGTVAGTWKDFDTGDFEGFERAADGTITTFDPSGSIETSVNSIDVKGTIVGF